MNEHPEGLLPWFANGTLADEERARVERHLAGCAHCRAELALLQAVRDEIKALDGVEGPGELARTRLLQQARRARPNERRRWMPLALAASLAIMVLQAAVLLSLLPQHDRFTPLGAAPAEQVLVQLRFSPHATERDMRAALQAVNASIVDGPSAIGVYHARLDALTAEDRERIDGAIATLRAAPVVTYVEREP